jgi:hypothetical protein
MSGVGSRLAPLAARGALLLGLVAAPPSLRSADFTLGRGSFSSGGGTSTNGTLAISGVIGYPATAKSSGGPWIIESGIWGAVTLLQTPDAPTLRLAWVGGTPRLRWAKLPVDWRLEMSPVLGSASQWLPSGLVRQDAGADWEVVIPPSPGHRFFRLRYP